MRKSHDRIHNAIRLVRKIIDQRVELAKLANNAHIGSEEDLLFGLDEAREFCEIFRAFQGEAPEKIRPKLERALKGSFHPRLETVQNATGRNTMFELALAAEWKLLGLGG